MEYGQSGCEWWGNCYGHPISASGTKIVVTLLYELIRRDLKIELATMCISKGQSISMIVENLSLDGST